MSVLFAEHGRSVVLEHVSWSTFEALSDDLTSPGGRITYDGGRLEIMSPSPRHEAQKKLLARLIETYTEEMGLDIASRGSTTFKRVELAKGLEPDECYYLGASAALVRGKDRIELGQDPPPDLAVEIEVTTRALPRLPVYAALGVREVWRYDGSNLRIESLGDDGTYSALNCSAVLPAFPIELAASLLARASTESETALVRELRAHVQS